MVTTPSAQATWSPCFPTIQDRAAFPRRAVLLYSDIEQFDGLAAQMGESPRPGLEPPGHAIDLLRLFCKVDVPILFADQGRIEPAGLSAGAPG